MKKTFLFFILLFLLVNLGSSDELRFSSSDLEKVREQISEADPVFTIIETRLYNVDETSEGSEPVQGGTVGVNTVAGSDCFIPLNTLLYIDFGRDNSWTGIYRSEDAPSEVQDSCQLAIFVDEEDLETHRGEVFGKTPDIYLLNDALEVLSPERVGVRSVQGFLSQHYRHAQSVNLSLFEDVNSFSSQTFDCRNLPNKELCVNETMKYYNTIKYCDDFMFNQDTGVTSNESLLLEVIKELAGCNSASNCGCQFELPQGMDYINISNGSVTFDNITLETGINISFDGNTVFDLSSGVHSFNSTANGLEYYFDTFERDQLCQPRLEHFFMCASYEDSVINDSNPVKFTVII